MVCQDCDVDPCVCGQSDSETSEQSEPENDKEASSDSQGDDYDDGGEDYGGDDSEHERGFQGFQGPPGPPMLAPVNLLPDYARFYGLTTTEDKLQEIFPGNAVLFPLGEMVGENIQCVSQSLFLFRKPGLYRVAYAVSTVQAGQLQLELGQGFDAKLTRNNINYVPLLSSTATNQNCVSGGLVLQTEDLIRIPSANSVLRLVNPATNTHKLEIAKPDALTLRQPRVHWISFQKL